MTYDEAVKYLYDATPQFQRIGAAAYKPGLDTARSLDALFGHPHTAFPTIHVAGTNGKGSTCHTLAAVFQAAGLKTGLYTSPHLVDFRERIRVDGAMMPREAVADFVERYRSLNVGIEPSFFELTTIMAFEWFARCNVDIAVIETGLGGRLDTTNIITPLLSVITNISFDHKAQLGDTLESIAREKAGIIKPGVPVVIGSADEPAVRRVFVDAASSTDAPIRFAAEQPQFQSVETATDGHPLYRGTAFGDVRGDLTGSCQRENAATVICALRWLRELGLKFTDADVVRGFADVTTTTGLRGRWMTLSAAPLTVCDTGHNEGGWRYLSQSLADHRGKLHMIVGFVSDKDVAGILRMMPLDAAYYFTRASVPRAMDASRLAELAREAGLRGEVYADVAVAYSAARQAAAPTDMIFIGGSTFVVADLLASLGDGAD